MPRDVVVDPAAFLDAEGPILDGRAPAEFLEGHVPDAQSFPLFDDLEREAIGKRYRHDGQAAAVRLGLDFVGPRLSELVDRVRAIRSDGTLRVHCWRGGMRSESLAWLLRTAGFDTVRLDGGYKAYRRFVRLQLESLGDLRVLGGYTGCGKTAVLQEVAALGGQVVDLEGLARHMGSVFGNLDEHEQPTTEQFSNDLHHQLVDLDPDRPVWVEDESRRIGSVWMPDGVYDRIRSGKLYVLERTVDERIDHLCDDYGEADVDRLIAAFERIRKRLGGQHVQAAVEAVRDGDLATAAQLALRHYDQTYEHGLVDREPEQRIDVDVSGASPREAARRLLELES